MMDRSDAPAMAALVACPAGNECPAYVAASRPARSASFFTTRATSIPLNGNGFTCPWRFMERSSGPPLAREGFSAEIGHRCAHLVRHRDFLLTCIHGRHHNTTFRMLQERF